MASGGSRGSGMEGGAQSGLSIEELLREASTKRVRKQLKRALMEWRRTSSVQRTAGVGDPLTVAAEELAKLTELVNKQAARERGRDRQVLRCGSYFDRDRLEQQQELGAKGSTNQKRTAHMRKLEADRLAAKQASELNMLKLFVAVTGLPEGCEQSAEQHEAVRVLGELAQQVVRELEQYKANMAEEERRDAGARAAAARRDSEAEDRQVRAATHAAIERATQSLRMKVQSQLVAKIG